MRYFSKHSRISASKIQAYGERLSWLAKTKKQISPSDVVKDAAKPKSPLHDYFEWEDTKAAAAYRIWQARRLLNHLEIYIRVGKTTKTSRAYVSLNISTNGGKGRRYVPIQEALGRADLRKSVTRIWWNWQRYSNQFTERKEDLKKLVKKNGEVTKK